MFISTALLVLNFIVDFVFNVSDFSIHFFGKLSLKFFMQVECNLSLTNLVTSLALQYAFSKRPEESFLVTWNR